MEGVEVQEEVLVKKKGKRQNQKSDYNPDKYDYGGYDPSVALIEFESKQQPNEGAESNLVEGDGQVVTKKKRQAGAAHGRDLSFEAESPSGGDQSNKRRGGLAMESSDVKTK